MAMEPTPVEAIPLEYRDRGEDGLWPIVRVLAGAVGFQGLGLACTAGWDLARAAFQGNVWPVQNVQRLYVVMLMSRVPVGACLAVAGWLAFRRSRAGRSALLWLEGAVAVVTVAEAIFSFSEYFWLNLGPQGWMFAASTIIYLPFSLLMPALIWLLFRRPEVRASFGGA